MPVANEAETTGTVDATKPLSDVKANLKKLTVGESTFNWTVGLIFAAWVGLFLLIWSLRKYNI